MHGRVETEIDSGAGGVAPAFPAFDVIDGRYECGLVIVCDHASNQVPPHYASLGLAADQLERHIAHDIGAGGVTRRLAELLEAPAVLSRFSRLLIDPNRGLDDPTLVMRISDGAVIPGNAQIDQTEIEARVASYYKPYDDAVAAAVEKARAAGMLPALLSIHSFTPRWRSVPRPWHAGVLWDRDGRFAVPLLEGLRSDPSLVVGNNEPYTGELEGDMMNRQGTKRGIAHALLEIRQDLITDQAGIEEWAQRLAGVLPALVADEGIHYMLESGV